MKKHSTKKMILTAIFAAMSVVLYLFPKFSLPFFPVFLEINFSMLPIIICGFTLGPISGLSCVALRCLIKIILGLSTTACVGECIDLMLGGVTVVAVSLAYNYLKIKDNKMKSFISLLIGCFAWVLMAVLLNIFFSIPAYTWLFFGGNKEGIIGMLTVIPGVNANNYLWKYIFLAVIPFNLMLAITVSIVTFFLHKKIEVFCEE